jgi:uncharacterized protein YjbJ (UPF0337 family)
MSSVIPLRGPGELREGKLMGAEDKFRNAADKAVGKVKEAVGKVTDDEQLAAEGKTDQTKADLKGAAENVKDAFKK